MKAHAHLNYQKQLVSVDAATPVYVIQFEVPAQLLLNSSFQHQAQSGNILHEINEAILQKKKRHCYHSLFTPQLSTEKQADIIMKAGAFYNFSNY